MEALWNKSEPLNEIEYLVGFTKIISNLSTTTTVLLSTFAHS